ncbi:MAG: TatD family hydrolase [Bacteroidales bacterium]|nr:TatD family hydrolase [Bacteroidales bacterium]
MELIDTHSHIYDEAFRDDYAEMIGRARAAGVVACVMPGIDSTCHDALCASADGLPGFAWPCIGLHPTSVGENWQEELDFVVRHLPDRPWRAIGEIGLDEYWSKDFVKEQMRVLEEQIVLAALADLPVIIHLREATDDFLRVLEDLRGVNFRGTMHAWTGSYEMYRRLLTYADFRFGIGGVDIYKNAGVATALERMSLQDLVLETDCPWLTPVPFRGRRNEPAYVRYVAEKVAQIKGLTLDEVAAATSANARRLFNIE